MSTHRRVGVVALFVAVAVLASGCTVAAGREGQEKVEAAIASAGLTGKLTADDSCSGALPGRVDSCQTRVAMTSDDRALIEKAAAVPELQGAQMELDYRGTAVALAPEDIGLLWKIYDTIGDSVTPAVISLDATQPGITVSVEPGQDLSALCGQAQTYLDGGELSGVVLVSLTQTPSGLQLIEVRADDTAEDTTRAWFADHPLPAGMEARVS